MMATKAAVVADPIVEIESLRERIAVLQGEIATVTRADLLRPKQETEQHVRELVRQAARQARLDLGSGLIEALGRLRKPRPDGPLEALNGREPFNLMCLLLPDTVEKQLLAAVAVAYSSDDGSEVMSAPEQKLKLAELQEQLYALEIEEERIIFALEKQGRPSPPRRGDANPAAVLHESTL
jgi:hypothetical protein